MILRPKNWGSFQHYKNRLPPWIKLHKSILDDRVFMRLPVASKALAPLLWLLASESADGEFDASTDELEFRLRMPRKDIEFGMKPLIDNGFFVVSSGVLAESLLSAVPEKSRVETEKEEETETETETEAPSARRDQVASVFDHWKTVMNHPKSSLDAKRRKLIAGRMKEGYGEDDLKSAINGCSKSAFHMGDNERQQRYDGLDLILRDASHIDKFLSLDRNPPVAIPPIKSSPKGESFRERDIRLAEERYAEMVGRPVVGSSGEIFDITPKNLEIEHASTQGR